MNPPAYVAWPLWRSRVAPGILSYMRSSHPGLAVEPTSSFPSPAQDYYEGPLDLNAHLIRTPAATFLVRVSGDGLRSAGIHSGDELVIDRSLDAAPGRIIVVIADGHYRVGRLVIEHGHAALATDEHVERLGPDVRLWGVATVGIRHLVVWRI